MRILSPLGFPGKPELPLGCSKGCLTVRATRRPPDNGDFAVIQTHFSYGFALLAGYMGKSDALDDALASFAMAYAAQTKHDHAQLKAATGTQAGLASK